MQFSFATDIDFAERRVKGKRVDLSMESCGVARSLGVIGDWWSLLIVRDAFRGMERFSEFQKSLNVARNILSVRLKKLVREGIFTVEPDPASAVSHRYVLTAKGEKLGTILVALWQWGEEYCFSPGELKSVMVDQSQGKKLAPIELRSEDDRVVGPRGFHLKPIS